MGGFLGRHSNPTPRTSGSNKPAPNTRPETSKDVTHVDDEEDSGPSVPEMKSKFRIINAARDLDFQNSVKLGQGHFGLAFKSRWKKVPCVVKVLEENEWGDKEFFNEAEMQHKVGSHPNCVTLFGIADFSNMPDEEWRFECKCPPWGLVMECGEEGSVMDFLKKQSRYEMAPGEKDYELIVKMARDAARGLLSLHEFDGKTRILHRDLKADNVILGEGLRAMLGDFGTARSVEDSLSRSYHTKTGGATYYTPPEIILDHVTSKSKTLGYRRSADIWSFGLFLLEICTGK
jgi:serine/threonine protein kinase